MKMYCKSYFVSRNSSKNIISAIISKVLNQLKLYFFIKFHNSLIKQHVFVHKHT